MELPAEGAACPYCAAPRGSACGELRVGRQRFALREMLGGCSNGAQYLAFDALYGRPCRVRCFIVDPARLDLGRVEETLERVQALAHPRVARPAEYFHENGRLMVVYPEERGLPLQRWIPLAAAPLDLVRVRRLLAVFDQVLDGLAAAHAGALAHGSLDQGEILVCGAVDRERVSLTAIGLSAILGRALDAAERADLQRVGAMLARLLGSASREHPALRRLLERVRSRAAAARFERAEELRAALAAVARSATLQAEG
jgi:hypothetical protein